MNTGQHLKKAAEPGQVALRRMEFESRQVEDDISFSSLQRSRSKYLPHDSSRSSFIHEKSRLLFRFQMILAISLAMSGFFSCHYEFDRLSESSTGTMLSMNVTFLTFLFTGLCWIEIWLDIVKKKTDANVVSELKPTQSYFLRWALSMPFLVHPNLLTYRLQITTESAFSRTHSRSTFKRNFNDYLLLIQLTLIMGKLLIGILRLSRFAKPRVHRLSRICGFSCTRSFVFKCHLFKDTLLTLLLMLCLLSFYFTIVFCITEAPVTLLENRAVDFFTDPFNLLESWVFVGGTLLLYGSGDIMVGSYLGACFATCCCYIGAFIIPFIAVAIERRMKMSQSQEKAFKVEHYQKFLLQKKHLEETLRKFVESNKETLTALQSDDFDLPSRLESLSASYQQRINAFIEIYRQLEHEIDKAAEPSEDDIPDHMTHLLILFNHTLNELKSQLESHFSQDSIQESSKSQATLNDLK